MLLPLPYFYSNIFYNIVKGLELTYIYIVLDLSLLRESRELDRSTSVSVSIFSNSSSIGKLLERGIILLLFYPSLL
jgi:hypothetical protein